MRKPLPILAIALLSASVLAHAQTTSSIRYKWVDGHGLPHFSDSLSAEAMKYGYDLVNDRGMVVGHVQRQLTPAERATADKLAAEQAAKVRAQQEVANAEAQMLAAYPDEASFKLSQQQRLDSSDQQIHTTQINLRSQEKALADLLARAGDIERARSPVPKYLVDSIAAQRGVVTDQRSILSRQQAERAQEVVRQAAQLARYRQLKAEQARPSD
jgi:hypothetical protein